MDLALSGTQYIKHLEYVQVHRVLYGKIARWDLFVETVTMVAHAFWVNTSYDFMHYFQGLAPGLLHILISSCMWAHINVNPLSGKSN